jgi:hypothetical protein
VKSADAADVALGGAERWALNFRAVSGLSVPANGGRSLLRR